MANKKYCKIHHFYYEGIICPFCLKDLLNKPSYKEEIKNK